MDTDAKLAQIIPLLPSASKILIALPSKTTVDILAAGLSLYLSLQQAGKQPVIATEDTLLVSHGNLYGAGEVKTTLAKDASGDYILTLEGVVDASATDPAKKVPAVERLDWYPEGSNLNLVFHIVPGQTFNPTKIEPKPKSDGFNLIFTMGAGGFNELGAIYSQNPEIFVGVPIVNIDINPGNTNFGQVNIIDNDSGTVCELTARVITGLSLPFEGDIASNVLTGVYDATQNLTVNLKPTTFSVVGQAMQAGGKIPVLNQPAPVQAPDEAALTAQNQVFHPQPPVPTPAAPIVDSSPVADLKADLTQAISDATPTPNLGAILMGTDTPNVSQQPIFEPTPASVQAPVSEPEQPVSVLVEEEPRPSAEEQPVSEVVMTPTPEVVNPSPDWLTPKVFKGTSIN